MVGRFIAWALITIVVAIPVWVYATFAGGATLYETGKVTLGHGGVVIAVILLAVGAVMAVLNRTSAVPYRLAMIALGAVVAGAALTAATT